MRLKKKTHVELLRRGPFLALYNRNSHLYEVADTRERDKRGNARIIAEFDTDSAATRYCVSQWAEYARLSPANIAAEVERNGGIIDV